MIGSTPEEGATSSVSDRIHAGKGCISSGIGSGRNGAVGGYGKDPTRPVSGSHTSPSGMDPVRSDPIPDPISPLPGLIRPDPAPIPDLTQSLLNGSDPAPDLIHCLPTCTRSFSAPPRPGSAPSPPAPTPKGNGSATATGRASQNAFRSIAGRLWHRP
jgi:hypothetical protein